MGPSRPAGQQREAAGHFGPSQVRTHLEGPHAVRPYCNKAEKTLASISERRRSSTNGARPWSEESGLGKLLRKSMRGRGCGFVYLSLEAESIGAARGWVVGSGGSMGRRYFESSLRHKNKTRDGVG